jgi:hypothetical protein
VINGGSMMGGSVEMIKMFSQSSSTKTFKIYVVPGTAAGFASCCFQLIGRGASFCTSRNCGTSHHLASVKTVKSGEIYVAKSPTSAFVSPSLGDCILDAEVVEEWQGLALTLSDWNQKFFIATAAADDLPASTSAIEIQEEFFRTKALTFKTPAKRRFETEDVASPTLELDVRSYLPFFKEDEEFTITEIAHVTRVLARLDEGVATNNEALLVLTDDYHLEHRKAGDAILALWLRMQAISASLGATPTQLSSEYMAPSAWALIGNLAAKLDKLGEAIGSQAGRFEAHKKLVGEWCESKINSNFSQHHKRMEEFKATFIGTVRALSKRIDNVEISLEEKVDSAELASGNLCYTAAAGTRGRREADALSRLGPEAIETSQQADEMAQGILARIESRMSSMETKLSALMAKGDERAINFAGLGFLSIGDSNAWLDSVLKSHPSGLIVDVHMVSSTSTMPSKESIPFLPWKSYTRSR